MASSITATRKQTATEALRKLIMSGRIRPGEQLRERDIAEQIGVSRTPLREAFNQLEREGLVESKPHRGYSVTVVDLKTGQQLYDLRKILDAYAATLTAEAITQKGIDDLNEVMAQLADFESREEPSIDDLAAEVRVGLRIHEIIARESGDPFLFETLKSLYGRLSLLIWVDVLWVDRWDFTRAEHREIVDAIVSRDGKRAAAAAETHVQRSKDDLQRVIDAQTLLHGSHWPPAQSGR